MHIVRVRTTRDELVWGEERADGAVHRIAGDIFGSFGVTPERLDVERLLAPLMPSVIIGIAQNYRAHAREMGGEPPERPVFFMKTPTSCQDPDAPIVLPRTLRSDKVDYEAELVVVIGRPCRNATPENALDFVLGFTVGNDVSARDWQKEWGGGQYCRGRRLIRFARWARVL